MNSKPEGILHLAEPYLRSSDFVTYRTLWNILPIQKKSNHEIWGNKHHVLVYQMENKVELGEWRLYWMVNGSMSTSIIFSSRPHFIFHFLLSPDTMFSILFLTSLHENPLHAGYLLPVPAYSALGPQQSLIEEVLTKYHHGLSIHDHQCLGHGHCHSVSQASVKPLSQAWSASSHYSYLAPPSATYLLMVVTFCYFLGFVFKISIYDQLWYLSHVPKLKFVSTLF